MKNRTLAVVLATGLLLVFAAAVAPAQADITSGEFKKAFRDFADDMASSLPLTTTIGNNTSDAYIGQLLRVPPNIGLGLTVGAATIPYGTVESLFDQLEISVPGEIRNFDSFGVPNPAYTIDARIGGIVFPFDFGVKFGTLGSGGLNAGDLKMDYLLAGGDVRYALVQQSVLLPNISLGVGYNYMRGRILVPEVVKDSYVIEVDGVDDAELTGSADAFLEWETSVIDLKAQISKSFIILTPYAGFGAAYGVSSAGGGLKGNFSNTDELEDAGIDVDGKEISVTSNVSGWSFRLFGGTSVNIMLLRLDLGLGYDILGENFVGTVGARVQL
ncbi:MAG: hypothetical protein EA384_08360 [Spirochaetaceae bacterium]|nr:MAG: hypothetical protein EA384_08360 [Spirochaetaceae bacterium]